MKNIVCIVTLLVNSLVFAKTVPVLEKIQLSVFGKDNRQILAATNPFEAVGRVYMSRGGHCTAFLVGPRVGMTAGHCLEKHLGNDIYWYPNNSSSRPIKAKIIEAGTRSYPSGNNGLDWAIFVLDKRFHQYLGYHSNWLRAGDRISLAGWSSDRYGATIHHACKTHNIYFQTIQHDCDLQGGASGGPIMVNLKAGQKRSDWRVVGIQSGHHANQKKNRGIYKQWVPYKPNYGCLLTDELAQKITKYKKLYK